MRTENNTNPVPGAMLSEQEHWKAFLTMKTFEGTQFGEVTCVESGFIPDEMVRDCGPYGLVSELSNFVADKLMASETPENYPSCWIDDLKCYLGSLKQTRRAFQMIKAEAIVPAEEPEIHAIGYDYLDEQWECEVIVGEEEEAVYRLQVQSQSEAA
jgi:hypothetical protein